MYLPIFLVGAADWIEVVMASGDVVDDRAGKGSDSAQVPDSEGESTEGEVSMRGPSMRQQAILDAYLDFPNAAAVGRAKGMSERNVRRLVHTFAHLLEEGRREREMTRLARSGAWARTMQDWADVNLSAALERLGHLVRTSEDRVALQAIKATIEVALRGSALEVDTAFRKRSQEIVARLEGVASEEPLSRWDDG